MAIDVAQHQAWLGGLIEAARRRPEGRLDITDGSGAVVATVQAHSLARRPKDMPRALRPKQKLSMRQRRAARLAKQPAS